MLARRPGIAYFLCLLPRQVWLNASAWYTMPIRRDRVHRLLLGIVARPIPVYQDHGLVTDNPGIVA